MRKIHLFLAAAALLTLVSCSRDPNVVKRRYLESGNRYFDRGKYKEAAIMYADALQKDRLWGPAHYKLGLTWIKTGNLGGAVGELHKAIERLPRDSPDHWDATVKICDIFLAAEQARDSVPMLAETEGYVKELLAHDSNSFDGHRLNGDLDFARARQDLTTGRVDEGNGLLDAAQAEYEKANAIKPGQTGVVMQMAQVAIGKHKPDEADKIYRQVIDKDKTFQPAYNALYRVEVLMERNMDAGEQTLKLAYRNNPKAYTFLTSLAMQYSYQGRKDDMLKVLQQIKSLNDFPDGYLVVGDFYRRLGDTDAATKEYREGQSRDPKRKTVYQKRIVQAFMARGKAAEAEEINRQILKDNPQDSFAKEVEGSLLLDRGDVAGAMVDLQGAVTADPKNPANHYRLGLAHKARAISDRSVAAGEIEQARQEFERALAIRPDFVLARLDLARIEIAKGDYEGAMKTAGEALKYDPSNLSAKIIESAALLGQKKTAEARQLLESVRIQIPNSPDVVYQLGGVSLLEKKYKEADEEFRRAYDLNPANIRGMTGLVETDLEQNKSDAAIQTLKDEISKNPERSEMRLLLADVEVRVGRFDEAIADYQAVVDKMGKNSKARARIYVRLGEAYRRKGDLANAIQAFQKARELTPDDVLVLAELALVLDAAQHWSEAMKVYEAAIKLAPNDAVSLNNDAFLIAEHGGDLDLALTRAQRATQLLPKYPEVADTLGWIYLKKNLSDQAIDLFKRNVEQQPNSSTYRYHLGMAWYQKGDKTQARQALVEALKYNPSSYEKQRIQELMAKL
ncbi:MAG TPA: tetratricopeptide repeat protein [Bryobacteraceae bacterium]|jgi:tetratricopeptide (TPR) repeat protein